MLYVSVFCVVWTLASVVWFYKSVGKKRHKDTLVDYLLCPPTLLFAGVIGLIGLVIQRIAGER